MTGERRRGTDLAVGTSLAPCVLAWPAARIGVPVNLAILAAIVLGQQLHPLDAAPARRRRAPVVPDARDAHA